MHIEHHVQNKESIAQALKNYESLKEAAIKHVKEKDKFDMVYLSQACYDVFFCKAFLGEDNDNAALRDFVESLTARITFALHVGEKIGYTFRNEKIDITPEQRDYRATFHLWNTAFFGAVLLDDTEILKVLTEMDLDKLAEITKKKNYTYNMAVALKAFYIKQKDYPELISKALEENLKVPKDNLLYDKAMDIDGPPLELLYLMLTERKDEFNEKLLKALEWHKQYFMRLEKKNMNDNAGLVSLPISAAVKLAKNIKQFTIAHTSDYMPGYLING